MDNKVKRCFYVQQPDFDFWADMTSGREIDKQKTFKNRL